MASPRSTLRRTRRLGVSHTFRPIPSPLPAGCAGVSWRIRGNRTETKYFPGLVQGHGGMHQFRDRRPLQFHMDLLMCYRELRLRMHSCDHRRHREPFSSRRGPQRRGAARGSQVGGERVEIDRERVLELVARARARGGAHAAAAAAAAAAALAARLAARVAARVRERLEGARVPVRAELQRFRDKAGDGSVGASLLQQKAAAPGTRRHYVGGRSRHQASGRAQEPAGSIKQQETRAAGS